MVDLIEEGLCKDCSLNCKGKNISCIAYDSALISTKKVLKAWLSSFDSSSATKCFTAVNLLKERLEDG